MIATGEVLCVALIESISERRDRYVDDRWRAFGDAREAFGRDADDRHRERPNLQRLAEDVARTVCRLPVVVRQDGDVRATRDGILRRAKVSA